MEVKQDGILKEKVGLLSDIVNIKKNIASCALNRRSKSNFGFCSALGETEAEIY